MKFLHTGDLHIGKRIFETSLIKDQKTVLNQIFDIAVEERVDAAVIAGDVYDRAVPSTEAVAVLDEFLTRFVKAKIPVIMISGNHDSGERVAFADRILEGQGLYIAGSYEEPLKCVELRDEWGPVDFVCMPFVKPAAAGCSDSAGAVEKMLAGLGELEKDHRYVLVTHFFVTGDHGEEPQQSDSETGVSVGGLDMVPASLFKQFSYVALGHIHTPQCMADGKVYYAGSVLKYSFSEARGSKSVNLVELDENGDVTVERRKLYPLHEMRCIRGRLKDLMKREVWEMEEAGNSGRIQNAGRAENMAGSTSREDYIQAMLTDTEELIDPIGMLRSVYPNVLQILLEKNTPREEEEYVSRLAGERKSTAALFADFYEMLKGEPMDEKRRQMVEETVREAEECI